MKKNPCRIFLLLIICFFLIVFYGGCSRSSGSDNNPAADDNDTGIPSESISSTLFGVNLSWERLGDGIMQDGDLLRDSSFRSFEDSDDKTADVWTGIDNGGGTGVISRIYDEGDPGYVPPAASVLKAHTGYLNISQSAANTHTGVFQLLISDIEPGQSYSLSFSSYGVSGNAGIYICLYDNAWGVVASGVCTSAYNSWQRHEVVLTPSAKAHIAGIFLYNSTPGEIKIDEVRMHKTGSEPSVKESAKAKIRDMGITSLRWPGGTLADWFEWKDSVGAIASRGEIATYNSYETPALGLHEFLNLCEELGIRPLITVNVRAGEQDAADLVEYITGPSAAGQGAVRALNGRTEPWNAPYFEIGNEPPAQSNHDYSYTGSALEDMGRDYAARAEVVASAMKNRAAETGKTIYVGGISETAFQLPDWMSASSASEIVRMIAKWNSQVFGGGLLSKIDFTHGHFYSSRYYHSSTPGTAGGIFDPVGHYKYLMTGGEVLKRTIAEKVKPLTGSLPVWITEYHVLIEEEGNPMPHFVYCMDYQSGLSIADMLMKMIESGADNAYAWNLCQNGSFGLLGNDGDWYCRPAGLVFRMLSVSDGEERLPVAHDNTATVQVVTGYGNVPSGLNYDVISVFASKNKVTGKPRLFVLNRDYSEDKTITVAVEGYTAGDGTVYLYNNADLLKNNETVHDAVAVSESVQTFGDPLTVTVPAHSFMRIDL